MSDHDLLPLLLQWIESDDVEPIPYEDYRQLADAGLLDDERRVPDERAWPTPKAMRLIAAALRAEQAASKALREQLEEHEANAADRARRDV